MKYSTPVERASHSGIEIAQVSLQANSTQLVSLVRTLIDKLEQGDFRIIDLSHLTPDSKAIYIIGHSDN